jgi:hypothetical protein
MQEDTMINNIVIHDNNSFANYAFLMSESTVTLQYSMIYNNYFGIGAESGICILNGVYNTIFSNHGFDNGSSAFNVHLGADTQYNISINNIGYTTDEGSGNKISDYYFS